MPIDYETVVTNAMHENQFVADVANHIAARTEAMRVDQLKIANKLLEDLDTGYLDNYSGDGLQRKIVNYVRLESEHFTKFDLERKKSGATALPEQIAAHKMSLILDKVKTEFIAYDETPLIKLAHGEFDIEESFNAHWPILRSNTYWGSTRGTIMSAKLLCIRFATSKEQISDYYETAIAHATPCKSLPSCFYLGYSKFAMKINNEPCFGFIHGGYAFGGQRNELKQYEFGPEDCSSIMAKWLHHSQTGSNDYSKVNLFSTAHQLFAWRNKQVQANIDFMIDPNIYDDNIKTYFNSAIESTPNCYNLQPGDIFLLRKFNSALGAPDKHAAGSGHTGVVIDYNPEKSQEVLVFECARDMEREDPSADLWGPAGCGIGTFSSKYEEVSENAIKRTMFMRPKM